MSIQGERVYVSISQHTVYYSKTKASTFISRVRHEVLDLIMRSIGVQKLIYGWKVYVVVLSIFKILVDWSILKILIDPRKDRF